MEDKLKAEKLKAMKEAEAKAKKVDAEKKKVAPKKAGKFVVAVDALTSKKGIVERGTEVKPEFFGPKALFEKLLKKGLIKEV